MFCYPPVIKHGNGKFPRNLGFNMKITYKWFIFHCHVSLPEGDPGCKSRAVHNEATIIGAEEYLSRLQLHLFERSKVGWGVPFRLTHCNGLKIQILSYQKNHPNSYLMLYMELKNTCHLKTGTSWKIFQPSV